MHLSVGRRYKSCLGFVVFFIFAAVYILLVNEQLNTTSSFFIEEGLRTYLSGVSTGIGTQPYLVDCCTHSRDAVTVRASRCITPQPQHDLGVDEFGLINYDQPNS